MAALTPLGARVLLKRPPISEQVGRIIIPDKYRMIPQEGVVVAVSAGEQHVCSECGHVARREPAVGVGQTVLHGRYSRMGLPDAYGDALYLVWERDLMAILGDT
jgi:co-chaperonin GroES (HSP10)